MLWLLVSIMVIPAVQAKRVALVIGNAAYEPNPNHTHLFGPLTTPVNDAADMSAMLQRFGFEVMPVPPNLTFSEMEAAIMRFAEGIQPQDVVVFYYSGHGAQAYDHQSNRNQNYLIPVGRTFYNGTHVKSYAVKAEWVLDEIQMAKPQVTLFILDACRNYIKADLPKGIPGGGLAPMPKAKGVFIGYAAAPGTQSFQRRSERNSLYTKHLLQAIGAANDEPVEVLFRQVATRLDAELRQRNAPVRQIPWQESGLLGEDFCFGVCRGSLPTPTPYPTPTPHIIYRDRIVIATPTPQPFRPKSTQTPTSPVEQPPHRLRSTPQTVSPDEALYVFGLDKNRRPKTYIENQYEDRGETVYDAATGLTWQKSGSGWLAYKEAQEYIKQLNRQKFAGFDDWRLPTIPELMSLLEPEKSSSDLYLDPIFDATQRWVWSADKVLLGDDWISIAWRVYFYYGDVRWHGVADALYVRAVRS